jgi:hypothetical protein
MAKFNWDNQQEVTPSDPVKSGKFNWDDQQSADEPKEKIGAGQAALEHFGNAAAMGYIPQLQAMTEKGIDKAGSILGVGPSGVDEKLRAQGFKLPDDKTYVQARDENIARLKQEKEDHPVASTLGSIGGGISGGVATSALTPFKAGAGLLGAVKFGAKSGALIGAVANPGDVEGEISPLQPIDRLKSATVGTVVGGGTGAVGYGAGKLLEKGADAFNKRANMNAVRATGASKADIIAMNKKGTINQVGQTLRDENIVPTFSTPKGISDRISGAIDTKEEALNNLISDTVNKVNDPKFIESATPEQLKTLENADIKPAEMAEKLKSAFREKFQGVPEEKIQPALDEIDTWLKGQGKILPLDAAQKLKITMNKFLKDSDYVREVGIGKQGTLDVQGGLRKGIENGADALASVVGNDGGVIKSTNRSIGNLIQAQKAAEKKIAGDVANRSFGLTDTIAAGSGMATGGAPLAAVLGAANKFARTFGDSMASNAQGTIAKMMAGSKPLADAIKNNPQIAVLLEQHLNNNGIDKPQEIKSTVNRSPAKGEDLWAQKGADKLGIDPNSVNSKEGKRLLIEASDLPPNSKRLQIIKNQLQGMGK